MAETQFPSETTQKLFSECDKENQCEFSDADFTNTLSGVGEIPKPARPSLACSKRETEVQLAERLVAYRTAKKQKRDPPAVYGRPKNTLQPLDTNVNSIPVLSTPTHKVSTSFSTPVATNKITPPIPLVIPEFNRTVPVASSVPKSLPSRAEGGQKLPADLAKERNIQRNHELNEREAKINLKATALKARETKFENDQLIFEKQKREHQIKLERCDKFDEEIERRELELLTQIEQKSNAAESALRTRQQEIEDHLQEREATLEAQYTQRSNEIDMNLKTSQDELAHLKLKLEMEQSKFHEQVTALASQQRQHEDDVTSLKERELCLRQIQATNETLSKELEQRGVKLAQFERELVSDKEKFQTKVEEHQAREVQLRLDEANLQARVNQAQEGILVSERLANKIARDEDTLKQRQKVLQADREKLIADTLDWQTFKEDLVRENEQLKNKDILVSRDHERLEATKRAIAGERATMEAEKVFISAEHQKLAERHAEQAQREEALTATKTRIHIELEQLKHKENEIEILEANLTTLQAETDKMRTQVQQAQQVALQKESEMSQQRDWLKVELDSVCRMKQEQLEKQNELDIFETELQNRDKNLEEERAKLQRIQIILAAEEESALERDTRYAKKEEELFAIAETCEKHEADLRLREAAVAAQSQELDVRFERLQEFQAVFNT